jgi:hypothetical protein
MTVARTGGGGWSLNLLEKLSAQYFVQHLLQATYSDVDDVHWVAGDKPSSGTVCVRRQLDCRAEVVSRVVSLGQ